MAYGFRRNLVNPFSEVIIRVSKAFTAPGSNKSHHRQHHDYQEHIYVSMAKFADRYKGGRNSSSIGDRSSSSSI